MGCGLPSSWMVKSECFRLRTWLPWSSVTVTSTMVLTGRNLEGRGGRGVGGGGLRAEWARVECDKDCGESDSGEARFVQAHPDLRGKMGLDFGWDRRGVGEGVGR